MFDDYIANVCEETGKNASEVTEMIIQAIKDEMAIAPAADLVEAV